MFFIADKKHVAADLVVVATEAHAVVSANAGLLEAEVFVGIVAGLIVVLI